MLKTLEGGNPSLCQTEGTRRPRSDGDAKVTDALRERLWSSTFLSHPKSWGAEAEAQTVCKVLSLEA